MDNLIFTTFDPFNDIDSDNEDLVIHLRLQMRTVRKSITIVEGLDSDTANTMLKELRKSLCTNGSIQYDSDGNTVVQMQGDKRKDIRSYLIKNKITHKDSIHVHGF